MKSVARALLALALLAGQASAQGTNPTFTTVNVTNRITHTAEVATPVAATLTNGGAIGYPSTHSIMTLNVSGTIATGSIVLPATASIASGFIVRIVSTGTVTALTMVPSSGQNIASAPTTISPVSPIALYWDAPTSTWRVLSAGSGLFNPSAVNITGGSMAGVSISGGSISGTPISGSTGSFTTLTAQNLTVSSSASGPGFAALFASPADIGTVAPGQGWFTNLNVSGTISGAAFDNIADFASPPPLGNVSPNTVNATNLTASGTVSGAGFTARFATPGPIGSGTASTGAFTNLSASGTFSAAGAVSGAGFTGLFASPPAIGSSSPNTGVFTSLQSTGDALVNDTLFAGAAATNNWLSPIINWPYDRSTGVFMSGAGMIGVTTASRTADLNPIAAGTTQITIGNAAFALADNTGTYPDDYFGAYAFYGEARVYPGTVSTAFAAELNAVNLTGDVVGQPSPYHDLFLAGTHALRLASGGGQSLSPDDALAALSIVGNDAKFQAGVIFADTAITGTDGVTGYGEAIQFARGHMMSWYRKDGSEGVRTSFITSIMDDPAKVPVSLQFQNNATLLIAGSDAILSVDHVDNAINGVGLSPSTIGEPISLYAFGTDTNIPLKLNPKGTGNIQAWAPSLLFYSDAGNQMAGIVNGVTDSSKITTLTFQDTGAYFYGAGGGLITTFGGVVNGVNYPSLGNAVTGSPALLTATGADTNVGLTISSKGTGTLTLNAPQTTAVGAFTGGAITATGTLTGQGQTVLGNSLANYLTINGAATSGSPVIALVGSDADIGLTLTMKGTGAVFNTRRTRLAAASLAPIGGVMPYMFQTQVSAFSGTVSSGLATGASFLVDADGADTLLSTDKQLNYIYGGNQFGGGNMKGGRIGLNISHALNKGDTGNSSDSGFFQIGISTNTVANSRDGGLMNATNGHLFAFFGASELRAGGLFWDEIKWAEGNVSIDEGGSATRKFGLTLVTSTTDAEEATTEEAFLVIGAKKANAVNSIGLRSGIIYGGSAGYWGIPPYGALIEAMPTTVDAGTPPPMTAAYGIDWSRVTFFGSSFKTSNAIIDGSGNIGSAGIAAGATLRTKSAIVAGTATVSSIEVLDGGAFTAFPILSITGGGGSGATAQVDTMGAIYPRDIYAPGTGYVVDDVLTLSGGTYTTPAQVRVMKVGSGGYIINVKVVEPGSYTVLPSSPVTFTGGSGSGAEIRFGWTILTASVTAPGSNYTLVPPPLAQATTGGGERLRFEKLQAGMTAVPATMLLANNYANYLTVTGAATSGSYGTSTISTAGSATYSGLRLTTKGTTSVVGTDRPFIQSTHTAFDTNAAARGPNTAFFLNNTYSYSSTNLDPRFRVTGSLTGTITGSTFAVNEFTVPTDNLNATSAGGLSYLYIGASAGGTTFTGNRTAITGKVFHNTSSPNQTPFRFMTGISGGAYGQAEQGGTGNNYNEQNGYIFGGLLQAKIYGGAYFSRQATGLELNVGSVNPTLDVHGIQIVREVDAPNGGIRGFAAYGIVDGTGFSGGDGWDFGFTYMLNNGKMPLNYNRGTVLGAPQNEYSTAPYTAYGVDFVGLTSLQAQFRGTNSNFMVDRYGNVGGQTVGGVALTTRGSITASTAVVNTITVIDGSLFITKPALTVTAPPGSGTQATADIGEMAADITYSISGGSGYVVGEQVTLDGGTYTEQAVYEVAAVSGGVPTRLTLVTPGNYTTLPSNPVSTTSGGSGTGLTINPWWTALTVTVTNPGSNYPMLPLPNVTAEVTKPDSTMTPLRRMMFQVAMTTSAAHMTLNTGSTVGIPMATPASAGAACTAGTITFDSSYIYACTATNTWKRAAISTW